MTLDKWIAVASSVGTVIAAIVAAVSVWVIRRQNKNQYRPRITIPNSIYEVDLEVGHSWKDKNATVGFEGEATLPLLNVGNGVATHLTVKWIYDCDELIRKVNAELKEHEVDACFQREGDWINYSVGDIKGGMIKGPDALYSKIDYIAAVSVQDNGKTISVDPALQHLTTARLSALGSSKIRHINIHEKYKISISIDYSDTIGNKYKEIIPINLTVAMWKSGIDGSPPKAIFVIKRDNS